MNGGMAALLILFGVPFEEVGRVMDSRRDWYAPLSEGEAVYQARKIAIEEGYLNDGDSVQE